MVPGEGLEPSRRETWDFKSHASAIPPPGHIHFFLFTIHILYNNFLKKSNLDEWVFLQLSQLTALLLY